MHRIDGEGHVANQFSPGDAGTGVLPTQITVEWLNALQEELAGVIEGVGRTLVKGDNAQLRKALDARAGKVAFVSAADLSVTSGSTSGDGAVGVDAGAATAGEVRLTVTSAAYFAGRFFVPEGAVLGALWVRLRRFTGSAVTLPLDVLRYDYNPTGSVRTIAVIGSATSGGAAAQAVIPATSTSTNFAWVQVPLIATPGTIGPGGYVTVAAPSATPWSGINITDFRLDFTFP